MSQLDPRSQEQYTLTFSPNKLILGVCTMLMLLVLCVMLGIRIERYQQQQAALMVERAHMAAEILSPDAPAATVQVAATTSADTHIPLHATSQRRNAPVRAEDLSDTVPPPAPLILQEASSPRATVRRAAPPAPLRSTPVAQAAPRPTATPQTQYVVQVVSSQDHALANQRAKVLSMYGVPAFVESADLAGKGTWYRVLAGAYPSKTEAKATLAKLQTDPQFAASFVRTY